MLGWDTTISEDFIVEVNGMSIEGRKFYIDKIMPGSARLNFL